MSDEEWLVSPDEVDELPPGAAFLDQNGGAFVALGGGRFQGVYEVFEADSLSYPLEVFYRPEPAHVLRTRRELDELPDGSVVEHAELPPAEREIRVKIFGHWYAIHERPVYIQDFNTELMAHNGGARVLYRPS